jgi:NitT/TauT family transport system substrate-binding protein
MLSRCLTLTTLALIFAASGCDRGNRPQTGAGGDNAPSLRAVKLQLNWKPEPQFGGFYAAEQVGAYRRHGLAVEIVPGGVGTPTVQMVGAGKVDFAVVSADELIIARSIGNDVVAIFAVYQTCPQGLMTHASRNFTQIGDIFQAAGTLALQRGLPYAQFLEKRYGFGKLQIVPSPGGDITAFLADPTFAQQCFVTSEPIAARRAGTDPQTFLVADAGYNPYTTIVVTRGPYLRENKEVARSLARAVQEGWRAYLDDSAATNTRMQQLNPGMDARTFTQSAAAQRSLIETEQTRKAGLGSMTAERWETLCRQLVDLKVIEHAPPARECFLDLLSLD